MAAPVIDHLRRSRTFWAGVCWVVVAVLSAFGLGFATFGLDAAPLPAVYEAVTRYVPGGLHTYGAVMLIYAAALVHGLAAPLHGLPMLIGWLRWVLTSVAIFGAVVSLAFALSWWLTSIPTWQAIVYWSSVAALAALTARFTPSRTDRPGRAP